MKSHIINVIKEKEIDALGKHLSGLSSHSLVGYSYNRRYKAVAGKYRPK